MFKFLKKIKFSTFFQIPKLLLISYIIYSMILGVSYPITIIILGLIGLYGYHIYRHETLIKENELLNKEIIDLKNEFQTVRMNKMPRKLYEKESGRFF